MAATKLLANTYKSKPTATIYLITILEIINEPIEGFTVELADESDLYGWKIWIEGPKDTL
jgi:ubiquitin-protein ligase